MSYNDEEEQGSFIDNSHIGRSQSPMIENDVCDEWKRILIILMEEKFLYQNVKFNTQIFERHVDERFSKPLLVSEFSKRPTYPLSDGNLEGHVMTPDWWHSGAMSTDINNYNYDEQVTPFYLPAINIFCEICGDKRTFGSLVASRAGDSEHLINQSSSEERKQIYTCYFQCGSCKSHTVCFQIKRNGLKLQLTGRSDPLRLNIQGEWPKSIKLIIEESSQAVAEGDVYAGFYHLRTAVEFYLKDSLGIEMETRITGEELVEKYNGEFGSGISPQIPSVAVLYRELSVFMHTRSGGMSEYTRNMGIFSDHISSRKLYEKYNQSDEKA